MCVLFSALQNEALDPLCEDAHCARAPDNTDNTCLHKIYNLFYII